MHRTIYGFTRCTCKLSLITKKPQQIDVQIYGASKMQLELV
jgi:hypothetical protein